jgi:hypothetical protein
LFRKRKEKIKEEIRLIIDFIEGKKPINEFKNDIENNVHLKDFLKKKVNNPSLSYNNYNYYDYFHGQYRYIKNWDIVFVRYNLQEMLRLHLSRLGYGFEVYKKYEEDYLFLLKMLPGWLDCVDDQGIFDKIIAEIPADLPKTKRIKLGKEKIKELFKYDKTYPRWVQGAEWPIVDGKPLVFSHQKKAGRDDERVFYYFYDPETKEETVIMQMY